jgi:hypothetical protein
VYNTVARLCSFLVVAGNSSQNENTFLQKNLIGLLYYDPLVSQKYQQWNGLLNDLLVFANQCCIIVLVHMHSGLYL